MSRLSPLTYRQVIQKLRTLGYVFDRQAKGSHELWRKSSSGTFVTVPNHPGSWPLGTLRAIIRQTGVSVDESMDL